MPSIDRRRYSRITWFFTRVILHVILRDVLGTRLFFLRGRIQRTRPARMRHISRNFRYLAADMGGVMIKLGQFLSARVDVLPLEITEELRGLQDEVPPVPRQQITDAIEREWHNPNLIFFEIEEEPMAAASLGQTHRAWLRTQAGRRGDAVVIKVQRPNIERLVNTDLAALRRVSRWVMKYRPIRLRANIPALMEEFAITLWEELDYQQEIENAHQFEQLFTDYEGVVVPIYYRRHCSDRVLVMENVEALKVTDLDGLRAHGIDTAEIADRLLDVYFKQVFEAAYFHADPHPGNIFIRPRPDRTRANQPTAFDLIFIDYGMMGRLPDKTTELLQTVLISVTTRDTARYIDAVNQLGFFLPDTDLDRISEAHEQILNQVWGRDLQDLARPDMEEVREMTQRFKDILYEFPFQVPQNFIYLGRALGILSGLSSMLNPTINPWVYVERFGSQLLRNRRLELLGWGQLVEMVRSVAQFPLQVSRVLDSAEKGTLRLHFKPDRATQRQLDRLEQRTRQINLTLLTTATLLSGTLLYLSENITLSYTFWGITATLTLWSLIRYR